MQYLKLIQIRIALPFLMTVHFLCYGNITQAQSDSTNQPFLKMVSAGIHMGGLIAPFYQNTDRQLHYINQTIPQSKLTRDDFSGYEKNNLDDGFDFISGVFADFNPINRKTKQRDKNTVYRFELIYNHKQKIQHHYHRADSTVVDSVYSPTTGVKFKDSTSYSQNYFYRYRGRNLGLGFSMIRYFREGKIIRPYLGFGGSLAFSYENQIDAAYSNVEAAYDRNLFYLHPNGKNGNEETYKLKNNLSGMIYIPFGLSLNGGRRQLWISPFIDAKIGLKIEKYPYPDYKAVPFISGQIGVRVFKLSRR